MSELWAYPTVSRWLLDDTNFNLQDWLADNVATEFALQEGAAFVNGDGIDKPRGFLTYDRAATADADREFGALEKTRGRLVDGAG